MSFTSNKLKILTDFNQDENKAVLVELDNEIFENLSIAEDGTVNTVDFIMACIAQLDNGALNNMPAKKPIRETKVDLETLIYDASIAVKRER